MAPWKPSLIKPEELCSPASVSPHISPETPQLDSPLPSPAKKPCLDDPNEEPAPSLVVPKTEPVDVPEDLSESKEELHNSIVSDLSLRMDSSGGGESSNWMGIDRSVADASSPGESKVSKLLLNNQRRQTGTQLILLINEKKTLDVGKNFLIIIN